MTPWQHVVSVSGGKDSTALYLLALERRERTGRDFIAVFADTGNEHEWTYDYVRELPAKTGGPEIRWVKADFTRQFEIRRKNLQKFWGKDGIPQETIDRAHALLVPTGNPFLDLCMLKGRFPSSGSRFCTEELKVYPIQQQVYDPLFASGVRAAISWQGVRAEESTARALLPKWQRIDPEIGRIYAYRPLLEWKIKDVWAMHRKHGIRPNPLYSDNVGMSRVGCLPCIMARKSEIRSIAANFPDHVQRIEEWEAIVSAVSKRGVATMFAADTDPLVGAGATVEEVRDSGHGIRSVVEWSRTARGGRQYDLMLDPRVEFNTACNQWGACE